ncbi:trypsin-like peptidase domain-containing protein [Ruegeria sp. 2205SS24-7]|uniref:trypsin-like peptidase domain-containing protein n=1 Tax=Ruegeria discodermiae TaxID=3064389 RepID=UPI0027424A14|nr:trypsin-like peptidase domain-containing protein [Ruegeria sp. 2205SS24-7]MDP5217007.1 trypsin-like peptidase domain-containing protein [Ruegeria sp. 2205SS24-7]
MAMPLDYARARPFAAVNPIIDATNPWDAIRQIASFAARHQNFRVGVQNTSYFPFTAICKLVMTRPSGTYGGTGFYIAPDLILTAGHNLFGNAPGTSTLEEATSVSIRPGQQSNSNIPHRFSVRTQDWTIHPTWRSSGASDRTHDMAVIRVTQGPPNGEHFHLINYSPSPEAPIAVCGYGGQDVASDRQHLDIDRVRRLTGGGEIVEYNLQTRKGNSGSPVFAHFNNDSSGGDLPEAIPVMGVHVARGLSGDSHHNRGVLLTPDKIDWARGGGIMSVAQSLSRPGVVGGLPLMTRSRASVGGLPLMPAQPMPVAMPAPEPAPMMPKDPAGGAGPTRSEAPVTAQGYYAQPFARSFIVANTSRGMSVSRRTFGHDTHDISGTTVLEVSVPNMPDGGSVRWNIPDADDRTRVLFEAGSGTAQSASGTRVTLRSLAPGVAHVDCMVKDSSGTTIESNKYLVSSPHFVKIVFDANVDTFLDGLGLRSRRAALIDEMREVMQLLYEDTNIRLIFPGENLPAHLVVGANAGFPGGEAVAASVSIANVDAQVGANDPEESHDTGTPTAFGTSTLGRNHQPGDLPAPLNLHNVASVLLGHMRVIDEVETVEDTLAGGSQSSANLDLAAQMYGRLMGETTSHEVGHFPHGSFIVHGGSLMQSGSDRSFAERTGMAPGSGGAILTDNGRNTINRLSDANRRAIENVLPIDPPLDIAGERARGRVGSFSMGRAFSDNTVHLPGATVLEGWQAEVLIFAIENAIRATAGAINPATYLAAAFIDFDMILTICDRLDVTIGFGGGVGAGLGDGATAGAGIVFAPGRRIGFYGALSEVTGWVASAGVNGQFTVVRGGPENFGGTSYTHGVTVETIGWFDDGLVGMPVGAHVITNTQDQPIGVTFEIGLSAGVPTLSLIEATAQTVHTRTTIATQQGLVRPYSMGTTDPNGDMKAAAIAEAIRKGATPEAAARFVDQLFT